MRLKIMMGARHDSASMHPVSPHILGVLPSTLSSSLFARALLCVHLAVANVYIDVHLERCRSLIAHYQIGVRLKQSQLSRSVIQCESHADANPASFSYPP